MDTCAPSRMSSSQTGGVQSGLLALSFFSLNAGRLAAALATGVCGTFFATLFGALLATFFAAFFTTFFATFFATFLAAFFTTFFTTFFAGRFFFLLFELRCFSMKRLATPRAVNGSGLAERILEVAPTGTRGLERVVPTDNTM